MQQQLLQLNLTDFGIVDFTMSNNGAGYGSNPIVTITGNNTIPAVADVNRSCR